MKIRVGGALLAVYFLLVGVLVDAEDVGFVVMIPEVSPAASDGYTPLVPALKSVLRLAAEHVAQDEVLSEIGNVSLAVVESADSITSVENLCSAIGLNGSATYAVSECLSTRYSVLSFFQ